MAVKKGLWTDNNTGDILYPQTSGDMIEQDSNHRLVTDVEKNTWNGKANASHSHNYAGSNSAGGAATTALACTGNSATATKATQDSSGQQINSTYIKSLSVSGRTITYTKGNGATGTITTQDTNTTYNVATSSANGLMSSADKAKLDGVATGANKYTHPSTHPATVITEDSSHRFVTDEEKNNWNNLQRDNLLINADFRYGAINQRGKTSYSNANVSVYGIDAWKTNGLQVLSNSVKLTKVARHLLMWQAFRLTDADTYTLTYKARASRKLRGETYETGRYHYIDTEWTINSYTFKKSEIPASAKYNDEYVIAYMGQKWAMVNGVAQELASTDWVEVEWVKLEEGDKFTGLPKWEYATELKKCQFWYMKYDYIPCFTINGYLAPSLTLPVPMRVVPTVKVESFLNQDTSSNSAVLKNAVVRKNILIHLVTDISMTGMFNYAKNVELDAGFY